MLLNEKYSIDFKQSVSAAEKVILTDLWFKVKVGQLIGQYLLYFF